MIVIQHQDTVCSGHYAQWLPEHRLLRPYLGDDVPSEPREPLVVLGGAMNALSDEQHPWLPAVRNLMAAHVAQEVPLLGICLGAQLLSVATGGGVVISDPKGTELGVTQIELLPDAVHDPLFAGMTSPFDVICAHSDGIAPLPPDATLLARSSLYPQAFRVGAMAWGVQYHPEVSILRFNQWAAEDICSMPDSSPEALARITGEVADGWDRMAVNARQLATNFGEIARRWHAHHPMQRD